MKELLAKYEDRLPKLFLKLYNDFQEEYVAEYEFMKESTGSLSAITGRNDLGEDFYLFFRNPVGSLYGFWILDPNDFSKNPIVQFSRDGEFGVLATNFDQFLSQLNLLGADAWQLSKYVSKVDFRRYQGDYSPLTKEEVLQSHKRAILKQEEIQEHIETVKKDFGGINILNWLTENEIAPIQPEDLFDRVLDTYLACPNLQDFLEKRGRE